MSWSKFSAVRLEADEVLAARGYVWARWWGLTKSYPRISQLARERNGANAAYAKSIAIAKRINADIDCGSFLSSNGTLEDVAVLLSEFAAFPERCSIEVGDIENWKRSMQRYGIKFVKKHIRSQGSSFVTKNGVNPCEPYMAALTKALDAPRFAGLNAWYKRIGLSGVDLSALPSEAEVARIKQDILDGEIDMTQRYRVMLYVCLGVEGYNTFVKEYNGDK